MAQTKRTRGEAGVDDGAAAAAGDAAAGGAAASPRASDEDGASGLDEDDDEDVDEEEVLLPGADDPSYAEQHALWKERRFIDIWLQARTRTLAHARLRRDLLMHSAQHCTRVSPRAPSSRHAAPRCTPPRSLPFVPLCAGGAGGRA
jgi:hypothetical protein